ncbi:MAG: hypothetical protein PW735_05945 [Acidobacteriaceae bacterium]|nr:hypothetical protein [Acidobacteriaceae bacterium]
MSAKSSIDPANKLSITPVQDGMHVVMSGEAHLDFTANTNGKQAAAPGNLGFNQIEWQRVDQHYDVCRQAPQITVWTRTGGAKAPKDPFAGEWTQDLRKTRMKQVGVLKIEADGSGGVRFLGEYSYTAHLDGKSYDVKNSRNDTVSLSLADPHTVDATYRRDNQVTQKDKWQVSGDGQQMTLSTTATLETGQHLTEKLVFKKQ